MSEAGQWPIVGHQAIIEYLQRALDKNQVSHAYFFVGPNGIGKAAVARQFSQALLCQEIGSQACGECEACQQVSLGIHPDWYWLERSVDEKTGKLHQQISIEQVRQLQQSLQLRSSRNGYRAVTIAEAEFLSTEGANALLKLLEEPADKIVFLLLANRPDSLPKTIQSRCQVFTLLPVSQKETIDWLVSEGVNRSKAKTATVRSFGRPGVARRYAMEVDVMDQENLLVQALLKLPTSSINERFAQVEGWAKEFGRNGALEVLELWTRVFRDLLLCRTGNPGLAVYSQVNAEVVERVAVRLSPIVIQQVIDAAQLARRQIAANVNPRLALENLALTL